MASSSTPLAERLWGRASERSSQPLSIPAREPGVVVPLSFSQQPMWLAERIDPGTAVYNEYEAFVLRGKVDPQALAFALERIVERHEILRTAFREVAGRPVHIILSHGSFPLETIDRSEPRADPAEVDRLCDEFVARPFDFAAGRLARALLVRLALDEHVFVLALHHIVRDGWAMGVLLEEISRHVSAYVQHTEPQLPALRVQYGDFCVWQHRLDADGAFAKQRAYWLERLAGAPTVLDVLGDRTRPARDDPAGGVRSLDVARPVVDRLRTIAADANATFFMTLAAAFQTFLHRYTGEADMLTGFPVSGRVLPETEPLVGCFINTAVLRTGFEPGTTFRALLEQVRRDAFEAYDNRDFAFEQLVESLRPERRAGQNPVVQTLVTLVNPRRPKLELPGVAVQPLRLRAGTAKLDLALEMAEHAAGLTCRLQYGSALYDEVSAARMLDHFAVLLRSIAADPDRSVATLEIMSDDERRAIVTGWNPHVDLPVRRCAHEMFEDWAARTPDALAVESGDESLSYGELNRRADDLAQRLRRAGAGPNRIVGILLDRSPDLIVALLGALKAGAAYLPLDTGYPAERLAYMRTFADADIVVTDTAHATGDVSRAARCVLTLDGPPPSSGTQHDVAMTSASPNDLAYVMFTSGSTGTPKGVMIEHGALAAYLTAMIEAYGLRPGERMLQFGSPSFDVSVKEIFGSLAAGATLVLRNDAMLASPAVFLETCDAWGITSFSPPTAYWHELAAAVEAGDAVIPPSIRSYIIGGETASAARVAGWQQQNTVGARLYNGYGPTETTVAATRFEVPPHPDGERFDSVPIGRPLSNARCYVLDPLLQPVSVNVAGELYIGGSSVARGYLGDPVLTAARFLADPFVGGAARMYRTGDRARLLADGNIEFLGRLDRQLKILGFRVEPGEIENALVRHPAVREAVVDVDDATPPRLVAFVTTPAHSAPAAELGAYVRGILPPYMVPARVIVVDAIPMTGTMKVDRNALRALARDQAATEPEHVEPQTPLERAIAEMWRTVLEVERVGATDDFFALGGHSLLGASLVARINERFGVTIPLRRLFEERTVRALAAAVTASCLATPERDTLAVLLDRLGRRGDLPASATTP